MITIYLIVTGALWATGTVINIRKQEAAVAVIHFALFATALYCLARVWGTAA